jgi:predicted ATPase
MIDDLVISENSIIDDNNRFIITGGPGAGKTTLVSGLQALGYPGFPEIARDLINLGVAPPIWADKADPGRFFDLVLKRRILSHQQINEAETGFYDRGLPDSLAYISFQNKKVPLALSEAIEKYRYNPVVFAAPPWMEIFSNDSVRRESFAEASVLYDLTVKGYLKCGYQIVELPNDTVEIRIEYIRKYIQAITAPRNDK